jgi:FMN phosphatase YigB (HAD superfamily)
MAVCVIFFDIGEALGQVSMNPDGRPLRLSLRPYMTPILTTLRDAGLRLGVISNTGDRPREEIDALLRHARIFGLLEQELLLYSSVLGIEKNSPEIFLRAAQIAQQSAPDCMFVGESSAERTHASTAQMQVCPHPLLIDEALRGETFRYVRIVVPPERVDLAKLLQKLQAVVSPALTAPQTYVSTGPGEGQRDPAERRSDHTPFQERGYAACVSTEDFFTGPHPDSPAAENNPKYHRNTGTFVDPQYAADIARVVAAAAWVTARS